MFIFYWSYRRNYLTSVQIESTNTFYPLKQYSAFIGKVKPHSERKTFGIKYFPKIY